MSNIKIIKQPYLVNGEFTNESGQTIKYYQLAVDVQIGDITCKLTKSLRGFEPAYISDLLSADNAFNENDIVVE